jgi:integrase
MALHVKQLGSKPIGMHADAGGGGEPGLYLQVTASGRSWILRYQLDGRRREMGLGSLNDVGLADARAKVRAARHLIVDGIDPIEQRDQARAAQRLADARAVTFKAAAEAYIKANQAGWRNAKHAAQWPSTLARYAYPKIGSLPVAAIDTDLVLKCIEPIWHNLPETARRVRGRIEAVLASAIARGQRGGPNPAVWRGHLDQLLPARAKVARVRHQPALPYQQIPDLMKQLAGLNRPSVSSMALRFAILTAARTGETIGAVWDEFDLEAKQWTRPAERMKGDREHKAPLSDAALAIVEAMKKVRTSKYVFPGWREKQPLSDMAMLECLRGLRPGFTVHGFRSSFKDWAGEQTTFPDFLSEMALAHIEGDKARAAYARSDLLERRRELMEAWADYACGKAAATAGEPTPARRRKGHQRRA